jgi:exodeoxyribonuclease V alpha subunit
MNKVEMLDLLEAWVSRGWLRELDLALTRFLVSEAKGIDPALMLASALVSHQLGRGHVCLDLEATINDPYMVLSLPPEQDGTPDSDSELQPKDLLAGWTSSEWISRLCSPDLVSNGEGNTPLVLVGNRLYLRRYWRYERQVEAAISQRLSNNQKNIDELPEVEFKATLDALFPTSGTLKTDWQKVACALAARSAFSIVTGGPGTGKTTTVVRLLALLQTMALEQDMSRPKQIRLAAPTGKAAARLRESIAGAINKLPASILENEGIRSSIPTEVTTIHRLLGVRPNSRLFRHDARNPLPLDVLVIDEASMVDLEMMAAVLSALPSSATLILLGDKDQLASVEAGSVLGELCRRATEGHFQPETAQWVEVMTGEKIEQVLQDGAGLPLDQQIIMLRESHRFDASSGIGQLASAVNAGDTKQIKRVWDGSYPDLHRYDLPNLDDAQLESILVGDPQSGADLDSPKGYANYLDVVVKGRPALNDGKMVFDAWASEVLQAHGRFQLLCALRNGPFGVNGMNQRVENILRKRNLIKPIGAWYEGRPILVTRNDYKLGLMNGDIGITLKYPSLDKATGQLDWTLRVAFPKSDGTGGIHWVLPSRLLSTETVYALTVHKSQGSEFEHCALLLPPERNPVLTRELVYTGITRGKRWFSMICVGNPRIVDEAASRTVQRSGGLFVV